VTAITEGKSKNQNGQCGSNAEDAGQEDVGLKSHSQGDETTEEKCRGDWAEGEGEECAEEKCPDESHCREFFRCPASESRR